MIQLTKSSYLVVQRRRDMKRQVQGLEKQMYALRALHDLYLAKVDKEFGQSQSRWDAEFWLKWSLPA